MSLIAFHRVLIGAAAVFFAGYGIRELTVFTRTGGGLHLVLAAGSALAAVLLVLYLRRLRRFLRLPD